MVADDSSEPSADDVIDPNKFAKDLVNKPPWSSVSGFGWDGSPFNILLPDGTTLTAFADVSTDVNTNVAEC